MVVAPDSAHVHRLRWLAFSTFVIASVLNYLDRFLLNQLAPLILADLHFNKTAFGWLLSFTAVLYAFASLIAGGLLDRWGVNRVMSFAVAWWSLAGIATGLARSLPGLYWTRGLLAIGESAGIPAVSKVNGLYLKPEERALGTALNGIGLSIGLAATPGFVAMAAGASWRKPFFITGIISLFWIPLWLAVSRRIPGAVPDKAPRRDGSFRFDGNLWLLVLANVLWMGAYSLWSNWITFYLMGVYKLTLPQSARYSWIPLFVSNIGGIFGGWLSLRWIRAGSRPVSARKRAVWWSALLSFVALALPAVHAPGWGTVLISASFFFALAGSVNIYALAIDLYGAAQAGTAVAAMTCAYGLLQAAISPLIGSLADRGLYQEPVVLVTIALLLSATVLTRLKEDLGR
jgi:ACS family hexuronate transporter-like MFS transporter